MTELPKAYEAKTVDSKWYEFWENHNFFKADSFSKKPPYCIVMPPPNVTGALHMGHALVNTLQDILIRWKRMLGFECSLVAGYRSRRHLHSNGCGTAAHANNGKETKRFFARRVS